MGTGQHFLIKTRANHQQERFSFLCICDWLWQEFDSDLLLPNVTHKMFVNRLPSFP